MLNNLELVLNYSYILLTKADRVNVEDSLVSLQNSTIFFVLWLLILLSLYGTFYAKATPVHKVIALLLLSIFTVFLWMYVTQFLFIYLVYILAFIGAVLMLFLSVVLMLPISTLNNPAAMSVLGITSAVSLRPPGLESVKHEYCLTFPELFSTSFLVLALVFVCTYYLLVHCWYYFVDMSYRIEWNGWVYFCIKAYTDRRVNPLSSFMLHERYVFKETLTTPLLIWLWNDHPLPFQFKGYRSPVLAIFDKIFGLDDHSDTLYSRVMGQLFSLLERYIIFISFVFLAAKRMFVFFKNSLKETVIFYWNKLLHRSYLELLCQSLLTFSFFLVTIPVGYSTFTKGANINLSGETDGGLSNLKTLLYEQTGLFLLLSTIVLLVALIGAAVMTRNKK